MSVSTSVVCKRLGASESVEQAMQFHYERFTLGGVENVWALFPSI